MDGRIPLLLQTPAAVRFISAEPLLGAIILKPSWINPTRQNDNPLGWVICGGESGPGARPMHVEWAQSLVDQCQSANVPVFVKQLGAHVIQDGTRRIKRDKKGKDMNEWPHELRVRQFPEVIHASR